MKPKQSLGQNFLQNISIVRKIVAFSGLTAEDSVLEIGPGKGILTDQLIKTASQVVAIEKDDGLFGYLQDIYKDQGNLKLIHGDVLEYDLSSVISPGMKIVANLPYNIATHLIIRLGDFTDEISAAIVMVQKEVAERICARAGDKSYSALSVIVAASFDAVPGFVVGPGNFFPRPKVDSQVIKLLPRAIPFSKDDKETYKSVVYHAFSQRRKMLKNSLMGLPNISKDMLSPIAEQAGISLNRRPQDLSPEEYYQLARQYRRLLAG